MIGHVAPEAAVGGPIGFLREGDIITVDVPARSLNVELSDAELNARKRQWQPPTPPYRSGVMAKYAHQVAQADDGAVTNTANGLAR
jgi:dihydroxy-acid dehydratase